MTLPLHRGTSRIPEGNCLYEESSSNSHTNCKEFESIKHNGHDSLVYSHSLRLWTKRDHYGLVVEPIPISHEIGTLRSPLVNTDSATSSDMFPSKPPLGSSSTNRTLFSEWLAVCFSRSEARIPSSSLSASSTRVQSRRWLALQCTMLGFASIFILIAVVVLSSQGHSTSTLPKLNLYKTYRRLQLQINSVEFSGKGIFDVGAVRSKELQICPHVSEHMVPCYNVSASLDAGFTDGEEYDRHCELSRWANQCYVPAPTEYRIPFRWPGCRDRVWKANVKATREQLLAIGTQTKRLMLVDESLLLFQSDDDSQIADVSENYAHQISTMIGVENDSLFNKAGVRTVLEVGCGYGSFGAHLLSRNVLSLCLAPYETHSSHVQFALERGLPAMIGSLLTKQLPFSAGSFDMIHCAECGVDWILKGGIHLLEVDRLLRPGGYFVWTSSLGNPGKALFSSEHQKRWKSMEDVFRSMCWDLLSQQEQTFIWKKKADKPCYVSRELNATPGICVKAQNTNSSSLYKPLSWCVDRAAVDGLGSTQRTKMWPDYLAMPSGALPIKGYLNEELSGDSSLWSATVKSYWSLFTPIIFSDHPKRPGEDDPLPPSNMVRNVMDMNAALGSFNAGLLQASKPVWVMNVVPTSGPNTLPVIYNRGLLGVLHDWCEAFPTYPRTYDLLHAIGLLSQEVERPNGCGFSNIFLEMDRILRPEGWVLIRDRSEVIEDARVAALQMRWETRVVEVDGDREWKLLVCQKSFMKT